MTQRKRKPSSIIVTTLQYVLHHRWTR